MSFLSLFMRQRLAATRVGRTSGINGLQGFPERCGERDRVRYSASPYADVAL
jgi:hypothetical protein